MARPPLVPALRAGLLVLLALTAGLSARAQMPTPTQAQDGLVRELQILVERQEYGEAVNGLKGVRPSERGAAWDALAVQAALGQSARVQQDGCEEAYEWLKAFRRDYGSGVAADGSLRRRQVDLGICVLQDRRSFRNRDERDRVARELLAIDPTVAVRLYAEAGYDSGQAGLLAGIAGRPEQVRGDDKLRAAVLAAAGRQPDSETPAQRQERYRAMKVAGWYDGWVAASAATLGRIGAEMALGRFAPATGESLALALVESGVADDTPAARVLVPPAVRLSSARTPQLVQNLRGLSPRALKAVEAELLRARPDEGFWFEGPSWDEGTALADITRLLPQLVKTARQECAGYRQDDTRVPVHVWRSACEWLR